MAEQTPAVSIIMPAFNEEYSIEAAINSIINQSFSDWELIIIDDCSNDKTPDIIDMYTNQDKRIVSVRNSTNLGLPDSLNKGLSIAKSEFIARADADDINLPKRIETQYQYLVDNPKIDVLGTGAYLIDSKGRESRKVCLPTRHEILASLPFHKPIFFHPSVMMRKRFFDKVGLYENYQRSEDKELWCRGLRNRCKYANLKDALIKYNTNGYIRSWKSIFSKTWSQYRIVRKYNIKHGYFSLLLSFFHAIFLKLRLLKSRSLVNINLTSNTN